MPRKSPDLDADFDFNIHVDPSCLSVPMEDDTPKVDTKAQTSVEGHVEAEESETAGERAEPVDIPDEDTGSIPHGSALPQDSYDEQQDIDLLAHDRNEDSHVDDSILQADDEPTAQEDLGESSLERDIDNMLEQMQDSTDDSDLEHHNEPVEQGTDLEDATGDCSIAEAMDPVEQEEEPVAAGDIVEDDTTQDSHEDDIHSDEVQTEQEEEPVAAGGSVEDDATQDTHEDDIHLGEVQATEEHECADGKGAEEVPGDDGTASLTDEPTQADDAVQNDDHLHEASISSENHEDSSQVTSLSPQTDRRTSLRTEALIQAAARAVVAKIEERAVAAVHSRRNSQRSNTYDNDVSLLSRAASPQQAELSRVHLSPTSWRQSRPSSPAHHVSASLPSEGDEGDSSSPHEADSDVFSDHSARSSLGSFEVPAEEDVMTPIRNITGHDDHTVSPSKTRSPRISNVSSISGISAYDREEEFVTSPPLKDRTPRMPFRTPSSVRALQMSSPTPSVFNGASPRSHRRSGGGGGGGLTVSRLGSPMAPTQYSPKGRSTPPRLKSRKEAPLVLLHVTLLPLRWLWGDVIDGLDSAVKDGFVGGDELSSLRDAWRQLQDRVGDTVLERGVLLPHPQNDYEVLEERLLEALELPLRRRARILQCGHYLGPSNVTEVVDESQSESEDEYGDAGGPRKMVEKRHWCTTCQGEIKYEDLGPGKVFRIKVYASNGLMKAGAWEACWKEMERVDVEVEPIVDTPLQRELERLSTFQVEGETRRREEEAQMVVDVVDNSRLPAQDATYDEHLSSPPVIHASPPSPVQLASSPAPLARSPTPYDNSEARRLRDEARLREIYGLPPTPVSEDNHAPEADPATEIPVHAEPVADSVHGNREDPYRPSPLGCDSASPSEEAHARRTQRRTHPSPYQSASLPELMLESVKVLLRDRKNVAIIVLSFFVLFLAVRPKAHGLGEYRLEVPLEHEYRFAKAQDVAVPVAREVEEKVVDMAILQVFNSTVSDAVTVTHGTGDVQEATTSMAFAEEATATSAVGEEIQRPASDTVNSPVSAVDSEMEDFQSTILGTEDAVTSDEPRTETLDAVAATVNDVVSASTNSPSDASIVTSLPSESHTVLEPPATTELASAGDSHTATTSSAATAMETTVTEKKVVRIIETVTETETVRVSVTSTESIAPAAATTVSSAGGNALDELVFELGGPYRLPEEDLAPEAEILGPLTLCGEMFCQGGVLYAMV